MLGILDALASRWLDFRQRRNLAKSPHANDFHLLRYEQTDHAIDIRAQCPGIVVLASEAAKILDLAGAANYLEFDMIPRHQLDIRPVRVTVQWVTGKSPAALAEEYRKDLDNALNTISDLHEQLAACEDALAERAP